MYLDEVVSKYGIGSGISLFIAGGVKIGNHCVIFHQVTLGCNYHTAGPKGGAPSIGNNVLIGTGAKIIGKIVIGDNCRLGANSVIVKDIPPNKTVVTAPPRLLEQSITK